MSSSVATRLAFALALLLDPRFEARPAAADELEGDAVYIPMPAGESLSVRNPMGSVRVRGWDQAEVRVIVQKRAQKTALLDRLRVRVHLDGGRLEVATGVYLQDGGWMPLPLSGTAIDLTIDAPRAMALRAATFAGGIDAAGLRAGARLNSQGGPIHVADVQGAVESRALDGRQSFQQIRGRLAASGITGDVDLEAIDGETVDAKVYKGTITARAVRSPVVRLRTTVGTIVFIGGLQPGGRYELSTHDGDLRLTLPATPFRLAVRSASFRSALPIEVAERGESTLRGQHRGGGPSLDLVSQSGAVLIDALR